MPLTIRANWIKELYPSVEVFESWSTMEGKDLTATGFQKKIIDKALNGSQLNKFYSTQPNMGHLTNTLECRNEIISSIAEKMRKKTMDIQANNYKNISRMSPNVYKDLITRVAFVGAQSTGKSTITEAIAKKYNTEYMFEYGRYHWDIYEQDRIETLEQILEITQRHLQMEDERVIKANKYLFSDTCPFVTLRYAYDWHGKANPEILKLAQEAQSRYDIIFLCGDDIPYADTPERDGIEQRDSFQRQIKYELVSRKIPYIELNGSLEKRIEKVDTILNHYEKYSSLSQTIKKIEQEKVKKEKLDIER